MTNTQPLNILDLPVDVLLLLFPHLDVASFLSFTSSCKALHKADFSQDSAFWISALRRDFRVPNQPVAASLQTSAHSNRYQKLYKRLRTQTKIFTWGKNDRGCLGHSTEDPSTTIGFGRGVRRRGIARSSGHVSFPREMQGTEELGVVSDLQCGGWSVVILNSKGALFLVGVIDALQYDIMRRPHYHQRERNRPTPLRYPPGFPPPKDRHDPTTAIKQFSTGRAHVLGLSDSGRLWSWQDLDKPALHVKFLHHEIKENGHDKGSGVIKKVVAGWNKSAALIEGSGIVLWEPLSPEPDETDVGDSVLVLETAVVPQTQFVESRDRRSTMDTETVGEVKNFIVLSDCVLFNTSLGKAFASIITWSETTQSLSEPVELRIPKFGNTALDAEFVTDVQGSFLNFAVFTRSGAVLTSNQDRLMPGLINQQCPLRLFRRIPALQNKQVISLAFGDYHFHALHAPGYITSYGHEPESCGALGLGGSGAPEKRLRGIRTSGVGGNIRDGHLVKHAYTEGRRVWFEEEKCEWICFLTSGGVDQEEAAERIRMAIGSPGITAQGEVSEWIEQQGRDWEDKFKIREEGADENDNIHFALTVQAAGHHSASLMLVDEMLTAKLKRAVELPINPKSAEGTNEGEADPGNTTTVPLVASPTTSMSWWDWAADYGRYFLGMAPYNVDTAGYDPQAVRPHSNETHTTNFGNARHWDPHPLDYGASSREGFKYVWSNDHFPRLRLSDGSEMPGSVPFDEWRYGRPDWKLNWEEEQNGEAESDA